MQHCSPMFQSTVGSSTAMGGGNFPVNSALMIGDYVTPGSIVLPTQGIQLGGHSSLSSSGGGGVRSPTHWPGLLQTSSLLAQEVDPEQLSSLTLEAVLLGLHAARWRWRVCLHVWLPLWRWHSRRGWCSANCSSYDYYERSEGLWQSLRGGKLGNETRGETFEREEEKKLSGYFLIMVVSINFFFYYHHQYYYFRDSFFLCYVRRCGCLVSSWNLTRYIYMCT